MTVEPYTPGGAWGDLGDVGLEDVSSSDIQMPRIQIDHDKAVFRDASTGVEMETLECVILGLVKQRIMWDTEVDDGDKPQCKSPNNEIGYPQLRTDIPARKQFPWARSGFAQADYPPNEEGHVQLPCASCLLAKWGADKSKPSCSEQYSFPLYYKDGDGNFRPGILSFQRSGLKAARTYVGTFGANKQPMFTVLTRMKLNPESRGKVVYATPVISRGGPSEADQWSEYADAYRNVRAFLHQAPRPATKEADEAEEAGRAAKPTPASAKAATKLTEDDPWSAPASAAPTAAPAPDDDLPF